MHGEHDVVGPTGIPFTLSIFEGRADAVPTTRNCTPDSPDLDERRGQPHRSAMVRSRPGGTAFLITVASAPSKFMGGTPPPTIIHQPTQLPRRVCFACHAGTLRMRHSGAVTRFRHHHRPAPAHARHTTRLLHTTMYAHTPLDSTDNLAPHTTYITPPVTLLHAPTWRKGRTNGVQGPQEPLFFIYTKRDSAYACPH